MMIAVQVARTAREDCLEISLVTSRTIDHCVWGTRYPRDGWHVRAAVSAGASRCACEAIPVAVGWNISNVSAERYLLRL